MLPLKISFEVNLHFGAAQFFFYDLPFYLFLLDIMFKFNTAYFQLGVEVKERKKIVLKYLKPQFFIDFITTIIFSFGQLAEETGLMNIFVLRLYTLYDKIVNIDERYQLSYKFKTFSELLKLVCLLFFIAHLSASGFHLISKSIPSG